MSRPDGFRQAVERLCEAVGVGAKTSDFDIADGPGQDLAGRSTFYRLVDRVGSGAFLAVLASPPCSTSLRSRGGLSGPQPRRGLHGEDRYGLRHLQQADEGYVKLGVLLAMWAAASFTGLR